MIDHQVIIGGFDTSMEVESIKVQQTMETDSDPGKITVVLANRHQMYTNKFSPQNSTIFVILYNYTYKNEPKVFPLFNGHITDLNANHVDATVQGECLIGHLADALPNDYESDLYTTPKDVLFEVMAFHTDYPIHIIWDDNLPNPRVERITYGSDMTYQDVLEDIRKRVGAVYYGSEQEGIEFRSPWSVKEEIDLDPYVEDPAQANSISGFRNAVVVVGDQSLAEGPRGIETSGSEPIIGVARDEDSIAEVGVLMAPTEFNMDIKTQEQADARAKALLEFYMLNKNAETKVKVVGMAPVLQSVVSYSPFAPISESELAKANQAARDRLKELQDLENSAAADQDRAPRKLELSGKIKGVVVAKEVSYSISGLEAILTISPGMLGPGVPVTDDDITYTTWDPAES